MSKIEFSIGTIDNYLDNSRLEIFEIKKLLLNSTIFLSCGLYSLMIDEIMNTYLILLKG